MTRYGRAVLEVSMTREVARDGVASLPDPPRDWFLRGPRGGLLYATGERSILVGEKGDDFIRNRVTVQGRSTGIRYVRPRQRSIIVEGRRVAVPEDV